ncbi:type II toxin-antitoxin system RatA family toxin [Anaplasmataceae bacterium AB001_6]|nr:type II toxin-antitoxin system RatA family toxin [Anaplasmataceae bacterium AB001_6]
MSRVCFQDSKTLPFDSELLFDVILDINKYPEFLRWCKSVSILNKKGDTIDAHVSVVFKKIRSSYTSHIKFQRPENDKKCFIEIKSFDGAFKYLYTLWEILPLDKEKTKISIKVEFEFSNKLLHILLKQVYHKAQREIIDLFENRIKQIALQKK